MACNSSFQGLTPRNAQDSKEGLCVTSLINGLHLQQNSSTSADPTFFTHPDLSQGETLLPIEKGPKSAGFLSLARELRDIIYSDLITSGDVAILRVSQQLHDEAKEILHKQGIFRIDFNMPTSGKSHNTWRPSVLAANNRIQNFNILMYLSSSMLRSSDRLFSSEYDKLTLEYIQSRPGSRDCHLTLILKKTDVLYSGTRILELVPTFSSFELFTLRIHTTSYHPPVSSDNAAAVELIHTTILKRLASSLQPALGHSEWRLDSCPSSRYQTSTYAKAQPDVRPVRSARYLEFHPRERNGRAQTGSTIGDSDAIYQLEVTGRVREPGRYVG